MESPIVSVLTPTHNRRDYLGICIESVMAQTFPHWEYIIVDDGSTDATKELVEGYRDHRIRYIYQEHVGVDRLGETYNRGLRETKRSPHAFLSLSGARAWRRSCASSMASACSGTCRGWRGCSSCGSWEGTLPG